MLLFVKLKQSDSAVGRTLLETTDWKLLIVKDGWIIFLYWLIYAEIGLKNDTNNPKNAEYQI